VVEKGAFVGMNLTLDEAQLYFTFFNDRLGNSESLCLMRDTCGQISHQRLRAPRIFVSVETCVRE
jgi:hypothetical protein